MTVEIRNPVKLPPDLNSAEKKFARCLAEGKPCIVGNGKLSRYEDRIESGEGANVVRSEVIRFFAYGGSKENPVSGSMIHLCGACISGGLDLTHVSIPYALRFDNCRFVASVMMQHAQCAALYLNGSYLAQGLDADGLTTIGNVHLRNGFAARGEVRLLGANIDGSLDCAGGKFYNPGEYALSADGLTTKGNVNLQSRFSAEGQVSLLNANIGGDLVCAGGKFYNLGEYALSADGLTTKGSVYLSRDFFAWGKVQLLGAYIGGNLDCEGGKFYNAMDEYALNIEGSNISGGLLWRHITCEGDVNLTYAKTDVLVDDLNSWKSCKVDLRGFTYNRFVDPMDAQFRIDWLAKRPDGMGFSPQPYEQAAKVLRAVGKDIAAWDIERKKNRLQRKFDDVSSFRKFGGWLLDTLKDAGYYPSRIVKWGLCIMALGIAVFACADYYSNIVPTHPVVALSEDYKRKIAPNCCNLRPTQAVPPEYPAFNPIMFSLDVFTPSAVFHQEDSWGPRSGGGDWLDFDVDILWFLTLWYWFEVAMGWILTSMLLLSVYGLLRPRQSSGERD